jgi:peptidoglycan-N-acetylglucosamine deacetylase
MAFHPGSWLRQSIRRGLAATLPRRVFLTHGPKGSHSVCLTFDDGPHPDLTPRLLDVLAELRVRATFFLIGREVERFPEVVRRMIEEGHSVGHHSYSHPPRRSLTARQAADETEGGAEALAALLGRRASLYRPPGGKLTGRDLLRLWRSGFTTVLWNVDPKDFNKRSADEIRCVFTNRPLESGDLVLFHDNHPHAIEILPELVARTRRDGLEFETVDAWTK